jgi:hypothetical protein
MPSWFVFGDLDRQHPRRRASDHGRARGARRTVKIPAAAHVAGVSPRPRSRAWCSRRRPRARPWRADDGSRVRASGSVLTPLNQLIHPRATAALPEQQRRHAHPPHSRVIDPGRDVSAGSAAVVSRSLSVQPVDRSAWDVSADRTAVASRSLRSGALRALTGQRRAFTTLVSRAWADPTTATAPASSSWSGPRNGRMVDIGRLTTRRGR